MRVSYRQLGSPQHRDYAVQPPRQMAITPTSDAIVISVIEAARLAGISRQSAYEAVRRGEIPTIRIGRRILVPKAKLLRILSGES